MEKAALLFAELQAYKENPAEFNAGQVDQLEAKLKLFLDDFLAGGIAFETDAAPELLTLFEKASSFKKLQKRIAQATQKLQKELAAFDERYGLTGLADVPADLVEQNIEKIDAFAQMPLKSRRTFKHIFDIISKITLTDEDGKSLGQEGRKKLENTVIELARTDTFLRLLTAEDFTVDDYFNRLLDAMQAHLVGLFYAQEFAGRNPATDVEKYEIDVYMDKLVKQLF